VFDWAVEQATLCDQTGFTEYWIGEHATMTYESMPSPELIIAASARRTENIKLCPGAHLLPYHHPGTLAVQTSWLSHVTQGRHILGIGAGAYPTGAAVRGIVDMRENHKMTAEAIEIMQRIWSGESVQFQGRYWNAGFGATTPPTPSVTRGHGAARSSLLWQGSVTTRRPCAWQAVAATTRCRSTPDGVSLPTTERPTRTPPRRPAVPTLTGKSSASSSSARPTLVPTLRVPGPGVSDFSSRSSSRNHRVPGPLSTKPTHTQPVAAGRARGHPTSHRDRGRQQDEGCRSPTDRKVHFVPQDQRLRSGPREQDHRMSTIPGSTAVTDFEALHPGVLGPSLAQVEEEHPFRQEFRTWLRENAPRTPPPVDERENFAFRINWQADLFKGGWVGPAWPREYGGRGSGALEQFMYYEELSLARAPRIINESGILLLGPTLMVHGTKAQKEQFLPGLLSGADIWCQGFSEPGSGSDLASLRTSARLDGNDWVINGQKIWTTWAKYAHWCFLLCRTDEQQARHRGLTMLIVDMHQPGIEVRPIQQITGHADFAEVYFDDARTPVDFTVGPRERGWATAMTTLGFERADQGYTDHARLLVELEVIKRHLVDRTGRATNPGFLAHARLTFADLWTRCQQLRRYNLRTAVRVQAGHTIGFESSAINVLWSGLTKDIAEFAAVVGGQAGLIEGTPESFGFLDSRAASIYSGTDEIQLNIVAERILGLPR
jgi:alkylation response protein AidB-like acyl-CoA dehydrogenase